MNRRDKLFKYLDIHRDELMYAKNGYKQPLLTGFIETTGIKLTASVFDKLLSEFRNECDCPIHYCTNKYYKPRPTVDGLSAGGYFHSYVAAN